jgi:hypothetical protein
VAPKLKAALHQQHQRRLEAAPKLKAALKAAVVKDVQPSNCEREGGKSRFPSFFVILIAQPAFLVPPSF